MPIFRKLLCPQIDEAIETVGLGADLFAECAKAVLYSRFVPETVRSFAGTSTADGAYAGRNASLHAIPGGSCPSELETDGEAHRVSIQNNEY